MTRANDMTNFENIITRILELVDRHHPEDMLVHLDLSLFPLI